MTWPRLRRAYKPAYLRIIIRSIINWRLLEISHIEVRQRPIDVACQRTIGWIDAHVDETMYEARGESDQEGLRKKMKIRCLIKYFGIKLM